MKYQYEVILICLLLTLLSNCELQSDLHFRRIAVLSLSNKENIKEIFLSKLIEETWIGAIMLCEEHGMEFLRIESQEELSQVFKNLKLHWLEFDDDLFIDGIKTTDRKWKFLTNEEPIDQSVFSFLQDDDNFTVGDFLRILKNGTNPGIGTMNGSDREKRKFLCQKTSINSVTTNNDENDMRLLKVKVESKMFESIGSYERFTSSRFVKTTFYINRNGGLSHPKASRFCRNFGMNLVHIDNREKYEALVKLLIVSGIGIDKSFIVADLRKNFLQEFSSWANTINLSGNQGRKEQCVSIHLNQLNEKGQIVYFDCNDEYRYQNFICETEYVKDTWIDDYPEMNFQTTKIKKKTTGMKYLGSIDFCKTCF